MHASAAAFDVAANSKMVADAQVGTLRTGFTSKEDMLAFQASTEALGLNASDALALTSLSLASATSFISMPWAVRDQVLKLELVPDPGLVWACCHCCS